MTSSNRRDFLRLAATAGAAGANVVPPFIQKALAIPANNETRSLQDVKHIVILMQENRSFDHYFGTLKGVRGFGDPRPASLPSGKPVFRQPANGGELLPFHPDAPELGLKFLQGTPHDWTSTHQAWNGGHYDQWVAAKGTNTMAYFTRNDIPFHYALADAFTVCDAYHCSLLGPTDPNRYHMWSGWVGNDGAGGGPVIDNAEAGYGWSTYPELLQAAGVSWKIYQDVGTGLTAAGYWGWTSDPYIGNYGDNSLLYFHQYQNSLPGSPLYEGALRGTNVAQDPAQTFFDILKADVANGTLPQVSWIVAPEAFSEHPNWAPNYGAWYTSQVLEILTSNADLWSKTAVFITYDENDGFFDHVVPPTPAFSPATGKSTVATTNDYFAGNTTYPAGPYGLGQRVPMVVVSPWTRGGWVCSQVFDHTSLIRFIEQRFQLPGLKESNITPWRRVVSGDLVSAFNFDTPNETLPKLPATAGYAPPDALRHADYVPVPPSAQAMPKQEAGLKWSRALPYDLAVHGKIDSASRRFGLTFAVHGTAGAVFRLTNSATGNPPRTYTVEAGKKLDDSFTTVPGNGVYDFVATGPGAFFRHFKGDAVAAAASKHAVAPEARSGHDGSDGGKLRFVLSNEGQADIKLTIAANLYSKAPARHYTLSPGEAIEDHWDVTDSLGWYDLSVTCEQSPVFLRRMAGRVENGKPRVSDPATA